MEGSIPAPLAATTVEKPRKRMRAARACVTCRTKKYKCDELYPCSQCKKQNVQCEYQGAENVHRNLTSLSYVADLERRLQELSAQVESIQGTKPANADPSNPEKVHGVTPAVVSHKDGEVAVPDLLSDARNEPSSRDEPMQEPGAELRDINEHTRSIEFHGNTSSMAFLALVHDQGRNHPPFSPSAPHPSQQKPSLVSTLHNVAFSPDSTVPNPPGAPTAADENYYFRHSRLFLDAYFENIHFIHPILNRDEFLARCEDLWFGRPEKQTKSFIGLYYSILSLGALIRNWDEGLVGGMDRFQWSRKLFAHARLALGELRSTNDLETIQCLIFMAKICQNELNPNLAYMYLGMAVRASLAAGYHREVMSPGKTHTPAEAATAISKTWWGLYSLEVEMSFSLGRPDSLGLEEYHNRRRPPIDDSEIAIIPCMISFARITRKVSVAMYLSQASMRDKISVATEIESQLDIWLSTLPEKIRPRINGEHGGSKIVKDPKWARRQRLVLHIRYCNIKQILYRPFLVYASQSSQRLRLPGLLEANVLKCVDAARRTIEIMHEAYRHHVFFRTWFYNTTYITYAASVILCYATQVAPPPETPGLFALVDMAVDIFESMEDCFVARKAGEVIRQSLTKSRQRTATTQVTTQSQGISFEELGQQSCNTPDLSLNAMLDCQMPFLTMDTMFDFDDLDFGFPMDDMHSRIG